MSDFLLKDHIFNSAREGELFQECNRRIIFLTVQEENFVRITSKLSYF